MLRKSLALAGSTGLLLAATLLAAPAASAQSTAVPAPAAPAAPAAAAGNGLDFTAMLAPVAKNNVTGSGELWVTLTGDSAKFTLQVGGLAAAPHAASIYAAADGKCPTAAEESTSAGHEGVVTLADAAPALGAVGTSLTVSGDTTPASWLALSRYPAAGAYTYTRTFTVDPAVAASIKKGTAVMVVHGIDYNHNGKYDGVLGTSGGAPVEATAPALCGSFVASQMISVPAGSANTGGGSTAARSDAALTEWGIAALAAAGIIGLVGLRRRGSA